MGYVQIPCVVVECADHRCTTGPVAWIVTSEVFPLSMRAKGVSIGGSSNWVSGEIDSRVRWESLTGYSTVEQLRSRYCYISFPPSEQFWRIHLLWMHHNDCCVLCHLPCT